MVYKIAKGKAVCIDFYWQISITLHFILWFCFCIQIFDNYTQTDLLLSAELTSLSLLLRILTQKLKFACKILSSYMFFKRLLTELSFEKLEYCFASLKHCHPNIVSRLDTEKQANLLFEMLDLFLAAGDKPSRLDLKPTISLWLTCPSVHLNSNTNPTAADWWGRVASRPFWSWTWNFKSVRTITINMHKRNPPQPASLLTCHIMDLILVPAVSISNLPSDQD